MALRLSTTSLEPGYSQPASSSLQTGEQEALRLLARAAEALNAGDTQKYVTLFDEAAEIDHDIPRYRAQKRLIESGLAAAGRVKSQREAAGIILAAAHGAIKALEQNPAEPMLLSHTGVLMYELWCLDAARALFGAAKRLDPEVPHLDRNLRALAQRGRSQHGRKTLLHPSLRDLARRATRVAPHAKPVPGLTISLCMIMRDEEEMLPRTLEAIAPVVDEMIIVDTGSTDRSIEIAKSFGATVIEREWTGDFSAARNVSLDAATSDWIIYLDADEVLVADDAERLRGLAGHTWCEAMFFHEINFTGREETGVSVMHSALRMLRNRPEYRFSGRLHEQIANRLPGDLPERIAQTSVRIEHYGYLGEIRDAKNKSRRNLELLQRQKAEGNASAFLHYNLGSEHFALGEVQPALAEFEESWRLIQEDQTIAHEFVPSLLVRLVKAIRADGRHQEAIEQAEDGLNRFPGFTDLVYEQGLACLSLNNENDGIAYLEKAISMGDAPSRFTALVGAGTFLPRILIATYHMQHGEPEKAVVLMQWCLEHTPQYFGIYHPYATAMLRAGYPATEIVSEIERCAGRITPTMRFMLATALYERGAAPEAEVQMRHVLEAQPHSAPARAALVEMLLYQQRYQEAAAEAEQLDGDSSLAAKVLRSELFARLISRDADGASSALARAPRLGVSEPEQALYRAWLARVAGGDRVNPIPAQAAPLIETMMEGLLRTQDFPAFEKVHELYGSVQLDRRERQERLAQMYMRRGFIRSAAREWMAACQVAPDPRALVGLARVAASDGQTETAETFAAEARALAPDDPAVDAALKFISDRSTIQTV